MDVSEIALRLGAAFATGAFLGFERETHGRAAGLRTTVLVCVAAAIAMVLSEILYTGSTLGGGVPVNWRPDPARLGAGILAGMGFLGGGVILRQGSLVRGVTTAALMWFGTLLGLCFGSGQFILGAFGTAIAALTLFVLPWVEELAQVDWYSDLKVVVRLDGGAGLDEIVSLIQAQAIRVKSVDLVHDAVQQTRSMTLHLKFKRHHLVELPDRVVKTIAAAPGVLSVAWS